MITCKRCLSQMDDGAIFCDTCGHDLAPMAQQARPTAHPVAGGRTATPVAAPYALAPSIPDAHRAAAPTVPYSVLLLVSNGVHFRLAGKSDFTIGRSGDPSARLDIDLNTVNGFDAGVSRQHLTIHVRPSGAFVEDLDSKNLTIHNGYRLMPLQWYPLRDGDELKLGAITIVARIERP